MKVGAILLCVASALLLPVSIGWAASITYVFSGTAAGTLGTQSFSSVNLSATATTDTSAVPPNGEEINFPPMPFTIDIGGIGTTNLSTGLLSLFHNASSQFVAFGFQNGSSLINVIEIHSTAFTTYDLTTSIGPITEAGTDPFISNWQNMPTSGGSLTVTSWDDVSFTATVAGAPITVPAPSAAWLSLAGLPLVAVAVRRRIAVRS